MTTKTVTIGGEDGAVVITKDDDGTTMTNAAPTTAITTAPVVLHRHRERLDTGSFVAGLMLGLLLYFIAQSWLRWQRHRPVSLDRRDEAEQTRMAADVAALARRTATLETIVTDPAHRTAREIEALR